MNVVELETKALANLIAEEIDADADQEITIAEALAWLIEFRYLRQSSTWPVDGQETLKRRMERLAILRPEQKYELLREADRLETPDFWVKLNAFCGLLINAPEYILYDWYKTDRPRFDDFTAMLTAEEQAA